MKLNKTWIFIIIGIVIIIAAGVTIGVLLSSAEPTEETEESAISVSKISYTKIKSMKISGEEIGEVNVVKEDGVWKYADGSETELDQSTMEAALTMVCYLYAQEKLFDSVEDKSVYGLDPAVMTIEIETDEGETLGFYFGNYSSDRQSVFMYSDASDAIYLYDLDSYSILLNAAYNMKDLTIDIDGSALTKIELMKTSGKRVPIIMEKIDDSEKVTIESWKLSSPFTAIANAEAASLVEQFFASPRFSAFAGETVKEEYGFDSSTAYIYLEDESGKSVRLNIGGRTEDGRYYCIQEGRDGVFELASGFESLFEIDNINLIPTAVFPITEDVKCNVNIDVNNEKYILNNTKSGAYNLNGDLLADDSFEKLNNALMGLKFEGLAELDISELKPDAVIVISNDDNSIDFSFYDYMNEFYAVEEYNSGTVCGYVSKADFYDMIKLFEET